MLKKPKDGWSKITIGDWCDRCGYIDNVPVELLRVFIGLYGDRTPSAVKFDAEGWEYIIVFDWYEIHIITDKTNKYVLKTVSCDISTLAKELIKDIRSNINEWAEFYKDLDSVDTLNLIDNLCDVLENNVKVEREV